MDTIFSSLFSWIGLAILGSLVAIFLKESKLPAIGLLVALTVGIIIFLGILPKLSQLLQMFVNLAQKARLNTFYMSLIFRILGIAYIGEFGAQICRDAGQGAIALKVELAAKIIIMLMAMPIMASILQSIIRLI
ncbi:MAG: stage III sporulation protein AD [Clostridiales bacterium]